MTSVKAASDHTKVIDHTEKAPKERLTVTTGRDDEQMIKRTASTRFLIATTAKMGIEALAAQGNAGAEDEAVVETGIKIRIVTAGKIVMSSTSLFLILTLSIG